MSDPQLDNLSDHPLSVPPLSQRYRFRDLLNSTWGSGLETEGGHVEYFTHEKSLKERLQLYFVKDRQSSLRIRTFNCIIKILTCFLYVVRVKYNTSSSLTGGKISDNDFACNTTHLDPQHFRDNPVICWQRLIYVDRLFVIWVIQTVVALVSFGETVLVRLYLNYKGNIWLQLRQFYFLLELVNTVPFFLGIPFPAMRNLFVPVFLNCWLAKDTLEDMLHDLHRTKWSNKSALFRQIIILVLSTVCLVFISACGVQHLQRGGNYQLTVFESFYFVIVTISTVGYGDISPDIWPSQLYMVCMIGVALYVLPPLLEQLAFVHMEQRRSGGNYSASRAKLEHHVVVCATVLHMDSVLDFLQEFYAHYILQDYYVVFLSPNEVDRTLKGILSAPFWEARVMIIKGSALKDSDLARCRLQDAEACFMLADRFSESDKNAADQHTILRAWAARDFAPQCPLYVQIFRPENKFHVRFARQVVCEDEFRYALLANNCLTPGTSTLVTLLLHTSRGEEGQYSDEHWHRLYGRCSGNEIYDIRVDQSEFFRQFQGTSFTYASFNAHKKYGVCLVAVIPDESQPTRILLNPGPRHILKGTDICLYLSITREEQSRVVKNSKDADFRRRNTCANDGTRLAQTLASIGTMALEMQHTRLQQDTTSAVSHNRNEGLKIPLSKSADADGFQQGDGEESALLSPLSTQSSRPGSTASLNQSDTPTADTQEVLQISSINRRPSIAQVPAQFNQEQLSGVQETGVATVPSLLAIGKIAGYIGRLRAKRAERRLSQAASSAQPSPRATPQGSPRLSDRQPAVPVEKESPKSLPLSSLKPSPAISICAPSPEELPQDPALQLTTPQSKKVSLQDADSISSTQREDTGESSDYVFGLPPFAPYIGISPTLCHLCAEPRPYCCLELGKDCEHCPYHFAKQYNWRNPAVILIADVVSVDALYNFVVPLRSYFIDEVDLRPIVIMVEQAPAYSNDGSSTCVMLECIRHFPLVYWMRGSIDRIEHLLMAGVQQADNVVVVNKELSNAMLGAEEDVLADCNTIVAVQKIYRMWPTKKIITELSRASNMRFMLFNANDTYSARIAKMEKKEQNRSSHIYYMFRKPFAAGNVFSASMLDTLLYQSFVEKDYLVEFVRLMLGIGQATGSGHLTSFRIGKEDLWIRNYGRLYQRFCSTTCEIPIGIYRTEKLSPPIQPNVYSVRHEGLAAVVVSPALAASRAFRRRDHSQKDAEKGSPTRTAGELLTRENTIADRNEQIELRQMLNVRLDLLGMDRQRTPLRERSFWNEANLTEAPDKAEVSTNDDGTGQSLKLQSKGNSISYVIINPAHDTPLQLGDIIYLLRPSSLSEEATPLLQKTSRGTTVDRHGIRRNVSMRVKSPRVPSKKHYKRRRLSQPDIKLEVPTSMPTSSSSNRLLASPTRRRRSRSPELLASKRSQEHIPAADESESDASSTIFPTLVITDAGSEV